MNRRLLPLMTTNLDLKCFSDWQSRRDIQTQVPLFSPNSFLSLILNGQLQTIKLEEGLDSTDDAHRSNTQLS